jgi:hypothetical protein
VAAPDVVEVELVVDCTASVVPVAFVIVYCVVAVVAGGVTHVGPLAVADST